MSKQDKIFLEQAYSSLYREAAECKCSHAADGCCCDGCPECKANAKAKVDEGRDERKLLASERIYGQIHNKALSSNDKYEAAAIIYQGVKEGKITSDEMLESCIAIYKTFEYGP